MGIWTPVDATVDTLGRLDSTGTDSGTPDQKRQPACIHARLPAVVISTIDLSQDRFKNRQQRWEVFRNRRPDDIEIDIEIRVDQAVSH